MPGSDNLITTSLIGGMPTVSFENANFRMTYNAGDIFNIRNKILPDGSQNLFSFAGSLPSVPVAIQIGIKFNVTSAGTESFSQYGMQANLLPGYTGSSDTKAFAAFNSVLGTGISFAGNAGLYGSTFGTTSGDNYGVQGYARNQGSGKAMGGWFQADDNDNFGLIAQGRTGTKRRGIYAFVSGNTSVLSASIPTGAVVADNTDTGFTIFTALANTSPVFTIAGTGDIQIARTVTAIGTTGAQTINKAAGTINVAAGQSSVDLSNSLVTADSIAQASLAVADSTCTFIKSIVPTTGHLVFTLNAGCNATQSIRWIVTN